MEQATLDFPRHLFRKSFGIGIDIGGSAIKMLYTTEEGDKLRVHIITMSRERRQEAFDFLRDKCTGKMEPGSEVFSCGIGGSEFTTELSEKLGYKIVNTHEADCLSEGLQFLSQHLPWQQFIQPVSQASLKAVLTYGKHVNALYKVFATPDAKMKAPVQAELDHLESTGKFESVAGDHLVYPVIVYVVGSAMGALKLYEDGTYEICCVDSCGGKSFMGLGSLLSNAKTFEEMCELAKSGDSSKVDVYTDSFKVDEKDGLYGMIAGRAGIKAFAFGHCVNKVVGDFQAGDTIRALISMHAEMIANQAYGWAIQNKIHQVLFVGGFTCTESIMQDDIAQMFLQKRVENVSKHPVDCYFVRNGNHGGSFGALLMTLGLNINQQTHL